MARRKVALSAAPMMTCGWPDLGIKTMVGNDWIPIAPDSSFSLSVSILYMTMLRIFAMVLLA